MPIALSLYMALLVTPLVSLKRRRMQKKICKRGNKTLCLKVNPYRKKLKTKNKPNKKKKKKKKKNKLDLPL